MNTNSPTAHLHINRFFKAIRPWSHAYRSSTFAYVAVLHSNQLVMAQARLRLSAKPHRKADGLSTVSIRAGEIPIHPRIEGLIALIETAISGELLYMQPNHLTFLKDAITGYSAHHEHPTSPSGQQNQRYTDRLVLNGVRRSEVLDHGREIELERELLPSGFRDLNELMLQYDFDLYGSDMFGLEVIAEPIAFISPDTNRRGPKADVFVHLAASLSPYDCTLSLLDADSNGRHFRYLVRGSDMSWKNAGSDLVGTCSVEVPSPGTLICRATYAGSLHDELKLEDHSENDSAALAVTITGAEPPSQIKSPRSVHVKIDQDYMKRLLEACQASEAPTFDIEYLKAAGLGYDDRRFEFHMMILTDHGFIERDDGESGFGLTKSLDGFPSWAVLPLRLTTSGHQFIEALSNKEVWAAIRHSFSDASIGTLKAVSQGLLDGYSRNIVNNIVNNTTHIGTAIHSPVQQAGAQSTQRQVITYGAQERADLARLVGEISSHLHELQLDATSRQKVSAQIATLQAQLGDEPDAIIVQQAGRTLRNITEGAIASLIATAVQPAVWRWVADMMVRLFP